MDATPPLSWRDELLKSSPRVRSFYCKNFGEQATFLIITKKPYQSRISSKNKNWRESRSNFSLFFFASEFEFKFSSNLGLKSIWFKRLIRRSLFLDYSSWLLATCLQFKSFCESSLPWPSSAQFCSFMLWFREFMLIFSPNNFFSSKNLLKNLG